MGFVDHKHQRNQEVEVEGLRPRNLWRYRWALDDVPFDSDLVGA